MDQLPSTNTVRAPSHFKAKLSLEIGAADKVCRRIQPIMGRVLLRVQNYFDFNSLYQCFLMYNTASCSVFHIPAK